MSDCEGVVSEEHNVGVVVKRYHQLLCSDLVLIYTLNMFAVNQWVNQFVLLHHWLLLTVWRLGWHVTAVLSQYRLYHQGYSETRATECCSRMGICVRGASLNS